MADLRQNSSVLGQLTVTGGGASTPVQVTGGDVDAGTNYDLLKLLDSNTGSIFRINRQNGTSLFEVLTTGTQIGGAYTLPHTAPAENQILTRASGASTGVVSWQSLPDTIGGYDVALGGAPTGGQALLFDADDEEWYAGNQTIVYLDLDGTTDIGATTDNTLTVGGLQVRETAITGTETDSIVINSTDTLETNDLLGGLVWTGVNASSAVKDFAKLYTRVNDTTNASEDSYLTAKSYRAGTEETGLEIHGKEVTIADEYTLPVADGDAGQVLKTDGNGAVSFADVSGSTAVDDLSDVSTTGIADGDGIRYNGTSYVAGKWGLGEENQVIEANSTTAASTTRTVTLGTETNFPTSVSSTCALDLIDSQGSLLESVRILEVDTSGTPVYISTQNKYGVLTCKKDNSGNDAKIGFNNQYADGGANMYLKANTLVSNYDLCFPSAGDNNVGRAMTVKTGSTTTNVELEFTAITLDSVTDAGASTTNSITTGTMTSSGSDDLVPGLQYTYTGAAEDESLGIVLKADNADVGDALPLIAWQGPDAGDTLTNYGAITCVIADKTNSSEDSYFAMGSQQAGVFVKGFKVAGDVITVGNEASSTDYTLPVGRGTNGEVLTTDGSGGTSWAAGGGGGNTQYFSKAGRGTLNTVGHKWYGDANEGSMEDFQSGTTSGISTGSITGSADNYFHNGFITAHDLTNIRVVGAVANSNDSDLSNKNLTLEVWKVTFTEGTDNGSLALCGSATQSFGADSQAMYNIDFDCTSNMPSDGEAFFVAISSNATAAIAFKFNLTFVCT